VNDDVFSPFFLPVSTMPCRDYFDDEYDDDKKFLDGEIQRIPAN